MGSGRRRFNEAFCSTSASRLSERSITALDSLVAGSGWQALRQGPGSASVDTVVAELAKLEVLSAVEIPDNLFDGVSDLEVKAWGQRAASEAPALISRHSAETRATLLASFVWMKRREVLDDLVDLLIGIVQRRYDFLRRAALTWDVPDDFQAHLRFLQRVQDHQAAYSKYMTGSEAAPPENVHSRAPLISSYVDVLVDYWLEAMRPQLSRTIRGDERRRARFIAAAVPNAQLVEEQIDDVL